MAEFSQDKKYNRLWKSSTFNETLFTDSNISRLNNNKDFLNQEKADTLYPSSQSFDELNQSALKSTTNQYITDDYIDDYFTDLEEFFDTYNTGSFTGEFNGIINIEDTLYLPPLDEIPENIRPSTLASFRDPKSNEIALFFFNGEDWVKLA